MFAHPDAWAQLPYFLTNFFAKLAERSLAMRLPGSEPAARCDPEGACLALVGPDLLEKDSVFRIQQHDTRGRAVDNLDGHPGTIPGDNRAAMIGIARDRTAAAIASPWRRVAAWMLDYLVIAAYLIMLTAASIGILASPLEPAFNGALRQATTAELVGFLVLTTPVVLYFALMEASSWQATLGKRALGIIVAGPAGGRLTVLRAVVREGARFLPWELSHALVWRLVLSPARNSFPAWAAAGFAVVYLLVFAYLVTLFFGSQHRTLYDRLAGSWVIRNR